MATAVHAGPSTTRFRGGDLFPPLALEVTWNSDGSVLLCSRTAMAPVPPTFAAGLLERGRTLPTRTLMAARGADGQWEHLTGADAVAQATRVAGWFAARRRDRERLMIVTGNSVAHAVMGFGAALAGIPTCPVSAGYATTAVERLRHAVAVVRPTVVFAENAGPIVANLRSVLPAEVTLVCADEPDLDHVAWADVLAHDPLPDVEAFVAGLDPDDDFRYLLTSGSTGLPKAVVQTHRMWCSLFSGANAVLAEASGWGVRTLDWMPWSHVAGLSVLTGCVLNGGEFYLDEGRPTPELFGATLRNLADVQPLFFANVPYAFAMLCDALEADPELRQRFFAHLQLCLYGGAGLPQPVYDRFQAMAEQTVGERVMFTTGYGATETTGGVMSITWPTTQVGVGLPLPGLEVALVPVDDDRYEARFRGECVMPGYLDDAAATEEAFDEQGFYRSGDALRWIDPDRPDLGLSFAGRLAEEFKLTTGTFVRGGAVRADFVAATSPVVADAVLCGEGHAELGALVWLNPVGCAATLGADATDEAVLDWIAGQLASQPRSSATRVGRVAVLRTPPDVGAGEMSDKGTVNQELARRRRAADIAALYAGAAGTRVLP